MTDDIVLRALKRLDERIEVVIGSACFVALYKYDITQDKWTKLDCEGALHVIGRHNPHNNNNVNALTPIEQLLLSSASRGNRGDSQAVNGGHQINGHRSSVVQGSPALFNGHHQNGVPTDLSSPRTSSYGFVILNRLGTQRDVFEDINPWLEVQPIGQFFMYKNASREIFCIWFSKEEECDKVAKVVSTLKVKSLFTRNHPSP